MDAFAIEYIKQKMLGMGYKNYDLQPVHVYESTSAKTIIAYNEYYFLMSYPLPSGIKIISDVNSFDDASSQLGISNLQEFSGIIEITRNSGVIDLEFVLAVPYINFN